MSLYENKVWITTTLDDNDIYLLKNDDNNVSRQWHLMMAILDESNFGWLWS